MLFASADFADQAGQLAAELPGLQHVFVMDRRRCWYRALRRMARDAVGDPIRRAETCRRCCASLLHLGLDWHAEGCAVDPWRDRWATRNLRRALLYGPEERCLLAVPMFHANGMFGGLFSMLECGGSVVILHDVNPAEMIRAIERERCTYTTGVPAMYKMMLREEALLAASDCSSLRFVICGSSEVPEDLLEEFSRRLGADARGLRADRMRFRVQQPALGHPQAGHHRAALSRTSSCASSTPNMAIAMSARASSASFSCARPAIWSATTTCRRSRRSGCCLMAGSAPAISSAPTSRAISRSSGRIDDRISCAGETIYPKEVENVLMEHPGIVDVAVVPMPDPVKGEVPVALVVAGTAHALTEESVKQFFLDRGAPYMHPRRVFFLDEMPLTPAKKVDRAALKTMVNRTARGYQPGGG